MFFCITWRFSCYAKGKPESEVFPIMSSGIGANEYSHMVQKASPPSHGIKNFLWAFFSGAVFAVWGNSSVNFGSESVFPYPKPGA